ncbi:MAG: DUF2007 domain-containing protein [Deltaproteobacteria bacterium]|nr:DUF2007 domain-containing protein [Deltaproteobacteria bacterium]
MKLVYIARNPTEAHLVKGLLEAEEIPAMVRGEHLFGTRGETPLTGETCPSVWILDDSQFEKARSLATAYARGEGKGIRGAVWRCRRCGEAIEPQFTQCWQCGTPRPHTWRDR